MQANRWARVLTVMCCSVSAVRMTALSRPMWPLFTILRDMKSERRDQAAYKEVSEAMADLAPVSDLGGETKGHCITEQWSKEERDPVEAHLSWLECAVQGTVAPDGHSWYRPNPWASRPQLQEAPPWLRLAELSSPSHSHPVRRQFWLADLTWALFKRWRSDLRWLEYLHTAVLMQMLRIRELAPRWAPEAHLRWVPMAMRKGGTQPDQMPHFWRGE